MCVELGRYSVACNGLKLAQFKTELTVAHVKTVWEIIKARTKWTRPHPTRSHCGGAHTLMLARMRMTL